MYTQWSLRTRKIWLHNVNFNLKMDLDYFVSWQSDLEETKQSILPVCDKSYHTIKENMPLGEEIYNLWNYPFKLFLKVIVLFHAFLPYICLKRFVVSSLCVTNQSKKLLILISILNIAMLICDKACRAHSCMSSNSFVVYASAVQL